MRIAAIPVKDHFRDFTEPLVRHLLDHENVDRILVYDNGSTDETAGELDRWGTIDSRVLCLDVADWSLYAMWSSAIRYASMGTADDLLLMNNDIQLAPGTLDELFRLLRADPGLWIVSPNPDRRVAEGIDPKAGLQGVGGTYRVGGILGWCMAIAAEHWRDIRTPIDERYRWWYGDDHLVYSAIERGGRCARAMGVPCDHVGEGTARDGNNEWTHAAKDDDMRLLRELWPDRP